MLLSGSLKPFLFSLTKITLLPTCNNLQIADFGPFSINFLLKFSFPQVYFPFPLILHKLIHPYFGPRRDQNSEYAVSEELLWANAKGPSWQVEESHQCFGRQILPKAKALMYIFFLREIHSLIYKQILTSNRCNLWNQMIWTQGTTLVHSIVEM